MPYNFNSKGQKPVPLGQFKMVPEGKYLLEIQEDYEEGYTNGAGYYKVKINFLVKKPNNYAGYPVKFFTVTFIPTGEKGAGLALHFLKTIGEPYEESDALDVDPARWVGKRLWAQVGVGEWTPTQGKNAGKTFKQNTVEQIEPASTEDYQDDPETAPY